MNQETIDKLPWMNIHSLCDLKGQLRKGVWQLVDSAEVIYGRNLRDNSIEVFYGRLFLYQIMQSKQPSECKTLYIDYDMDSTELEYLIALCETVKGKCDYTESEFNPQEMLGGEKIRVTIPFGK